MGGGKHVSIEWKCVFVGGESRAGACAPLESPRPRETGEKREGGGGDSPLSPGGDIPPREGGEEAEGGVT